MSIPNNKQFDRAIVWSDGVNQFTPIEQNISLDDTDDDIDTEVGAGGETTKWLNALENIQTSRTAPVTADEIDEAVAFRSDALPSTINSLISIRSASPGYDGLWNPDYRNPAWRNSTRLQDDIEADLYQWIDDNNQHFRDHLYECPYHIWPLNTGGHWEVLFMVLEKDDEHPTEYRKLIAYAVVDPWVSGGKASLNPNEFYDGFADRRSKWITARVTEILSSCQVDPEHNSFPQSERRIWVPKQEQQDIWSSGLRVIDFIWEMLRRIQDMESSGLRNIDSLFRPMRPYFNPDAVRLEAAGAIAARGIQAVDYRGRIVLARVNGITSKTHPAGEAPCDPRALFGPLARPSVEKIPQAFLDGTKTKEEMALASYRFTAPPENTDFKDKIPDILVAIAERYREKQGQK